MTLSLVHRILDRFENDETYFSTFGLKSIKTKLTTYFKKFFLQIND